MDKDELVVILDSEDDNLELLEEMPPIFFRLGVIQQRMFTQVL